jgi:dTDP-L-rhamnose 4-epimerase
MRVLVTGGAGFVGSHVADLLVEAGHEVVSLDRLHPRAHAGRPAYLRGDVEHIDADLADPGAERVLDRALDGVDAVCHQAAMVGLGRELGDVVDYVRDNDLGTAALLAAVTRHRRVGRLVLASSMVVYGEGAYRCGEHGPVRPGPRSSARLAAGRFDPPCPRCGADLEPVAVTEDAPPHPRSVYAATKLHQEHLGAACALAGGPPVTALRYHNVYGPRMPRDTPYAGVAAIFRSALAAGQPPRVL